MQFPKSLYYIAEATIQDCTRQRQLYGHKESSQGIISFKSLPEMLYGI